MLIATAESLAAPALQELLRGLNPALDVTPDGSMMAYVLSPAREAYATVWVQALDGSPAVQLPVKISQTLESGMARREVRPRWSPDGSKLAYIAEDGGAGYLHVWDRQTGRDRTFRSRAACLNTCPQYDIQWSLDSRTVHYLAINEAVRALDPTAYSTQGGKRRADRRRLLFHDPDSRGVTVRVSPAHGVDTHDLQPLSDVVAAEVGRDEVATVLTGADFQQIYLSPDGRKLLAMARRQGETKVRQAYESYYVLDITRRTATSQGSDAYRVLDWQGHAVRPVLADIRQFRGRAAWSPDSQSIAYAEQGALSSGDVFVLDVARGSARNLTSTLTLPTRPSERGVSDPSRVSGRTYAYSGKFGQQPRPPVWSRDGRWLYVLRDGEREDEFELWSLAVSSGAARKLTSISEFSVGHILNRTGVAAPGLRGGGLVVSARFSDGAIGFVSIDPAQGKARVLLRQKGYGAYTVGTPALLAVAERARLVLFTQESPAVAQEIFALDVAKGQVRQITRLNSEMSRLDGGTRRTVTWTRPDGMIRSAMLHVPPHASLPKPPALPPLVVQVYPRDSAVRETDDRFASRPDMYLPPLYDLLQSGYAILVPNLVIKSGGGACEDVGQDVQRALDAAGATGIVDSQRAAIVGHSFGGWTANCVVTRTDRFKAAVSAAGLSNLISNAFSPDGSTSALGGGQSNIQHSLWEAPELYFAESPAMQAPKVTTPLLLIHGKDDTNVPVDQSVQMYVALSRLGKTVSLALYDDSGHSDMLLHPDYAQRVTQWLEKYLGEPQPHR